MKFPSFDDDVLAALGMIAIFLISCFGFIGMIYKEYNEKQIVIECLKKNQAQECRKLVQ